MNLLNKFNENQAKKTAENSKKYTEFDVGDTISVAYRITEGNNTRVQNFEGVVIARKSGGVSETFTVRKNSYGVGVERVFPIHSPNVANIVVVKKGKVRRAKLGFLRNIVGQYKIKERGQK